MFLCSACLLGVCCKYDGKHNANKKVLELVKKDILIPVCPEELGGLGTPRGKSEIKGDKVFSAEGKDVTEKFKKGASETLKIIKLYNIKKAIFKQRSPSCGCGEIYDGTFSGKAIEGDGITTAFLKKNGVEVISEEDL